MFYQLFWKLKSGKSITFLNSKCVGTLYNAISQFIEMAHKHCEFCCPTAKKEKDEEEDDMEDLQRWAMEAM